MAIQERIYPLNLKKADRENCLSSSGVRNDAYIFHRLGRAIFFFSFVNVERDVGLL